MNSFYSNEELKELGLKSFGSNVFISRKSSLYGIENIDIENNVRIDDFCILSGPIKLGNYIHIAANSLLFAGKYGIEFEDFVTISSRCAIYAESDDYSGLSLSYPMLSQEFRKTYGGKVILRRYVLIGTGSTILPGIEIGTGSSIGAMSLVNKNIPEWSIFAGVPCHKIKNRSKKILDLEKDFISKR
jgi:galactoside O-acetyltransferase